MCPPLLGKLRCALVVWPRWLTIPLTSWTTRLLFCVLIHTALLSVGVMQRLGIRGEAAPPLAFGCGATKEGVFGLQSNSGWSLGPAYILCLARSACRTMFRSSLCVLVLLPWVQVLMSTLTFETRGGVVSLQALYSPLDIRRSLVTEGLRIWTRKSPAILFGLGLMGIMRGSCFIKGLSSARRRRNRSFWLSMMISLT